MPRREGQELFPTKRPDGTCSVSARFYLSSPDVLEVVEREVHEWVSSNRTAMDQDPRSLPRVNPLPDERVEVIFEGTADSRRWKDWMVHMTHRFTVASRIDGLSFECFYDLVGDEAHPASVRPR